MRKAFSLIELMIVIVIIGVVYTLAINNFQKIEEEATKVNLHTLKEYLQKFPHAENVKFLCLNQCTSCNIFVDGEKQKDLEGVFDGMLDEDIKVYRFDFNLGVVQQTPEIYFNQEDVEEDVCFSYTIDEQGIGEQVLIEYKKEVYDYSSFFGSIPIYETLQDAIDAKNKLAQEILK
jgi:prepilin-type N-terminal cleavage/methylation domain-containing protein